jgi:hypothetical protein
MTKIIISLLLLFCFPSFASASYSSGQGPQSVSTSSTLTLTVLPTVEHDLVSVASLDKENTLYSFSLRANTSWSISYRAYREGSTTPTDCQTIGSIGQRNLDNNAQSFAVHCYTPFSWANSPDSSEVFVYQIAGKLR